MNNMLKSSNMLFYILIFVILSIFTVESKEVVNLRYLSKSGDLNDNNKLLKLLETKDNIILKESLKIELESWKSIDIESKSIIGGGDDIKISLCIGKSGSIRFLNKIKDSEIFNITIELDISDNNEIKNGLINKIDNSKITKFHVIIEDNIKLNGNENGLNGLISNEIVNSEINDMGIIFNEMEIEYVQGVMWCLLSCNILNQEVKYYNGLFLKGNTIKLHSNSNDVHEGMFIGKVTNISFKNIFIDIESMITNFKEAAHVGLFLYESNTDITISNMILIIRKNLNFDNFNSLSQGIVISGLMFGFNGKVLIINHCLIDIHFNKINMIYSYRSIEKHIYFSATVFENKSFNLTANFLQVKYYYKDNIIRRKNNNCDYFSNCFESMMISTSLVHSLVHGYIFISNSYFYFDKIANAQVSSNIISYNPYNIKLNFTNSYVLDPKFILNNYYYLFAYNTFIKYNCMKSLGYIFNGSIIYDPLIPYYNYELDYVNYDMYFNKSSYLTNNNNSIRLLNLIIEKISVVFVLIIFLTIIKCYSDYKKHLLKKKHGYTVKILEEFNNNEESEYFLK